MEVAETSRRPASTQEITRKRVLELRPARKRKRELYSLHTEDEVHDGEEARALRQRTDHQAPFIDVQDHGHVGAPVQSAPPTAETTDSGVAANLGVLQPR